MDTDFRDALIGSETNVSEAIDRLAGDEELYLKCLDEFLTDQTMAELDAAIETREWNDAFTAAHAMKGLAGNMGFIPLFQSTASLVVAIRKGKMNDIGAIYHEVLNNYKEIIQIIRTYRGLRV